MTPRTRIASAVAILIAITASLTGCESVSHLGGSSVAQETSSAGPDSVTAEFVRVIDGDTIAVKPNGSLTDTGYGEHSVRLLGIDAPEMHKTTDEAPDCGAEAATEHLTELLAGQGTVTLTFDPVSDHTDRYGRSLAYVEAGDHDVNLEQSAGGFAEAWYPYGEPEPTRFAAYDDAAKGAETSGAGSWATCGSLGRQ